MYSNASSSNSESVLQVQVYLPEVAHYHHPFRHRQILAGGNQGWRGRVFVLQAWAFLMNLIAAARGELPPHREKQALSYPQPNHRITPVAGLLYALDIV